MKKSIFFFGFIVLLFFSQYGISQDLIPLGNYENNGSIRYYRPEVQDQKLYWPLGKKGLLIFDCEDPSNLRRIKLYRNYEIRENRKIHGSVNAIKVIDNIGYLAEGELGFKVMDFTDPVNPENLGSYSRNQDVNEFCLLKNFSILGLAGNGVEVVDISDLNDISLVSRKNMDGIVVNKIDIAENCVYVAAGKDGIRILPYRKPLSAFKSAGFIKKFYPKGDPEDLIISDNVGYLANGKNEIMVLDLSLPEHPSVLKTYETSGKTHGLFLDQSVLYVATSKGVEVFSEDESGNLSKISEYHDKERGYRKVCNEGNFLYVSYKKKGMFNKAYGIQIFQIK